MGFKCGIVGLPNIGKSTVFNALTAAGAASENYPFCTIDPNTGMVDVPDPRLAVLSGLIKPQKLIPASMEFVDIAGLVKGASQGEGLGNQFLGHIRQTEAIVHVVRCFDDDDIIHVEGSVDPLRDIDIISAELIIADYETVATALSRNEKLSRSGRKDILSIVKMLTALGDHLQKIEPARTFDLSAYKDDGVHVLHAYRDLHLLSAKRVVYVCNVEEALGSGDEDNQYTKLVKEHAEKEGAEVVILCGKLEEELATISEEERQEMIDGLGLGEPGLHRLIRAGYKLLGLQTYFTAGEKEIRAWTIEVGDKAPRAAGVIHSDFERGFICAEIYTVPDIEKVGSKLALKEKGLLRIEGKEYVVQDGDVMEFRFNV